VARRLTFVADTGADGDSATIHYEIKLADP
jgi:hypothetical protein